MTKTKHSEVYALLKGEILGGKYGKSRAVPSEMQLSRRCACSRTTVRKAMDELRHEITSLTSPHIIPQLRRERAYNDCIKKV